MCIPEVGLTALDEWNGSLVSVLPVTVHERLINVMQVILFMKHFRPYWKLLSLVGKPFVVPSC